MLSVLSQRFSEGGLFMWIILSVFAVAMAVVLDRLIFFFLYNPSRGQNLVAPIMEALKKDDAQLAEKIASKGDAPINVLVRVAINRYRAGHNIEQIRDSIEEASIKQIPRLSHRLNYLAVFANIATLLGLLGTIAGLQVSFSSLAATEAAKKAAMLAQGISQAMNTTAFGLIVAVPCMIMYTMLTNMRDRLIKDLDESLVRIINFMKQKRA
ncbi:MAG: MotA/TolQ/ExbB proton channel family protein [Chitinivibrionales bacterium]